MSKIWKHQYWWVWIDRVGRWIDEDVRQVGWGFQPAGKSS